QGGRGPFVSNVSRIVHDDPVYLCRRLSDRGLFGDPPIRDLRLPADLRRLPRAGDAELPVGAAVDLPGARLFRDLDRRVDGPALCRCAMVMAEGDVGPGAYLDPGHRDR